MADLVSVEPSILGVLDGFIGLEAAPYGVGQPHRRRAWISEAAWVKVYGKSYKGHWAPLAGQDLTQIEQAVARAISENPGVHDIFVTDAHLD